MQARSDSGIEAVRLFPPQRQPIGIRIARGLQDGDLQESNGAELAIGDDQRDFDAAGLSGGRGDCEGAIGAAAAEDEAGIGPSRIVTGKGGDGERADGCLSIGEGERCLDRAAVCSARRWYSGCPAVSRTARAAPWYP